MYKILIVEDDNSLSELLSDYLSKYGFESRVNQDFAHVDHEFTMFHPHIVLLDVNLPKYDGFYWCRKLRELSTCPIIFISARNGDGEQIRAMESGADDYMSKPFSAELILSKINAQLRRVYGDYAKQAAEHRLAIGSLIFDYESLSLENGEKQAALTKKEAVLAAVLIEHSPKVLSRERLLEKLWDDESFVEENTLNVNVARLRKKLGEVGAKVEIEAVRGLGYRLIEVQ